MSTTSLKLSDDLKQRAISAAESQGVSVHAFMISAIEQVTTVVEGREKLLGVALAAKEQMIATNKAYRADEVRDYIRARVTGTKANRPKAKSWQK